MHDIARLRNDIKGGGSVTLNGVLIDGSNLELLQENYEIARQEHDAKAAEFQAATLGVGTPSYGGITQTPAPIHQTETIHAPEPAHATKAHKKAD